jgi:hypothetical protein
VLRDYSLSRYTVDTRRPPRGVQDARVALTGPGGVIRLRTDSAGAFRSGKIQPGAYSLKIDAPGYTALSSSMVEVPPAGCGIAHVGVSSNASISGVVRRSDGTPASGVRLDLVDADPSFAPPAANSAGKPVTTDRDGRFSFSGLPGGQFVLGVNIEHLADYPDPNPPSYYPGVTSRAEARPILLQPNEARTNLEFTLPPPRAFRTVRVRLRWPDGSAPEGGYVSAWRSGGICTTVHDLKNGRFELKLLEGVSYWLEAGTWKGERRFVRPPARAKGYWVYAENYKLAAGTGTIEVEMVPRFLEPQWFKSVYTGPDENKFSSRLHLPPVFL